jgi:hypothetical protein
VALRNPAADFSQTSHGGWPVAAAIDGDPKTGWSVDPREGRRHVAIFETAEPVGSADGSTLAFRLVQGEREHSIGRLRLSVTAAKPPLPVPKDCGPRQVVVKGQAPPSRNGGLLVVTVEMAANSAPVMTRDVGRHFSCEAKLAGKPIACEPVLGQATYPAPWQAWRVRVGPSAAPQGFELSIAPRVAPNVGLAWKAHFIPN